MTEPFALRGGAPLRMMIGERNGSSVICPDAVAPPTLEHPRMTPRCHSCSHPFGPEVRGRSEECSGCQRDLHVCLNCKFYDRAAYNECREPQAERVVQKDRANFCDFFRPADRAAAPTRPSSTSTSGGDVRSALDALFKK